MGILLLASCNGQMERQYQTDADIVRIRHFDHYAQLLTRYYEKAGKYPFQNEKDAPVYVFIMSDLQEKDFKDTIPYHHYTVNDRYFFEELSNVLNEQASEKYDPQKVASGRPNVYIYMVDGDDFYFAVHLYGGNKFSKNVGKDYHKMELSNRDDEQNKLFSYHTLKNDSGYTELVNRTVQKQGYFDELEGQE
jgi:hypothetical protein